jgi:hypothetical protein
LDMNLWAASKGPRNRLVNPGSRNRYDPGRLPAVRAGVRWLRYRRGKWRLTAPNIIGG